MAEWKIKDQGAATLAFQYRETPESEWRHKMKIYCRRNNAKATRLKSTRKRPTGPGLARRCAGAL